MQWADLENSRKLFEMFLLLIDDGTLDEARGPIAVNSTFWSMLYGLAQARPEWIAEVLAHWLRRRKHLITADKAEAEKINWSELFTHDQFGTSHFHESASHSPQAFVRHVLPVVLEISDAAIFEGDQSPPRRDAVWPLFFTSQYEASDDACLTALIEALEAVAKSEPDSLKEVIFELKQRDTYVANTLLLNIYLSLPQTYAAEAADALASQPWRFHCGFSDSPYWTAARVIEKISPFLAPEARKRLEDAILNYSSEYERSSKGFKQRGRSSFNLLPAIPREFRSKEAESRYYELERKFQLPDSAPAGIRSGTVTSPIEKSAAEKMSDEQWLKAIEKYDSEYRHPPDDFLKGGAWELAGMFRDFVRSEPERFARLCLKLSATANPAYLERALDGLKETNAANDLKFKLCRKAFDEHRSECGKTIADSLGTIKGPLPNDLIEMLSWLATEHPDPEKELWDTTAGGAAYYGGDVLTNGINTTRGRAAEAIRDLILTDKGYITRFSAALERLATDNSLAVRACVASTLIAVAQSDWPRALRLFRILAQPANRTLRILQRLRQDIPSIFGVRRVLRWFDRILSKYLLRDDRLLSTQYVDRFIYYGLRDHFHQLRPVVERMLRSRNPQVQQAGARLASVAALYRKKDQTLVREAIHGTASQRIGVAKVASSNIADSDCRSWCETHLLRLFNDENNEVRREAAACFHQLKNASFEHYRDLVTAFAESKAYETDSSSILFVLEESSEKLPGITATICEKFLSRFSDEARDMRTSRSADVHMITKLLFRTYQQHQTDQWAEKCLSLIDEMCLEGMYDVARSLAEFER